MKKAMGKRKTKIRSIIESQTEEQTAFASIRIEELMNGELKSTIKTYISRYKNTFENKLGLTVDDLKNDIREQIWKGLMTHVKKKRGGASLKTYLNRLIDNRFQVLNKQSTRNKYNKLQYYGELFSSDIEVHEPDTEQTSLTLLEAREEVMNDLSSLDLIDANCGLIIADLQAGRGIKEIAARQQISEIEVIKTIKLISEFYMN